MDTFRIISKELRLRFQYNSRNKPKKLLRNLVGSALELMSFRKPMSKVMIYELDISTRLYNALIIYFSIDGERWHDTTRRVSAADLFNVDLKTFSEQRNVGKNTIKELDDLVKSLEP